jgi:hypothetical protein
MDTQIDSQIVLYLSISLSHIDSALASEIDSQIVK